MSNENAREFQVQNNDTLAGWGDWATMQNTIPRGEYVASYRYMPPASKFRIYDVATGQIFEAFRGEGGSHMDVVPASPGDTQRMRDILGNWSWDRRAILVEVNGEFVPASMNGMPHGRGISDTGMNGHFCIHFQGSTGHRSGACPRHQAAIREAFTYAQDADLNEILARIEAGNFSTTHENRNIPSSTTLTMEHGDLTGVEIDKLYQMKTEISTVEADLDQKLNYVEDDLKNIAGIMPGTNLGNGVDNLANQINQLSAATRINLTLCTDFCETTIKETTRSIEESYAELRALSEELATIGTGAGDLSPRVGNPGESGTVENSSPSEGGIPAGGGSPSRSSSMQPQPPVNLPTIPDITPPIGHSPITPPNNYSPNNYSPNNYSPNNNSPNTPIYNSEMTQEYNLTKERLQEIITEVIRGNHGNGPARQISLERAGLNLDQIAEVQRQVNYNVNNGTATAGNIRLSSDAKFSPPSETLG